MVGSTDPNSSRRSVMSSQYSPSSQSRIFPTSTAHLDEPIAGHPPSRRNTRPGGRFVRPDAACARALPAPRVGPTNARPDRGVGDGGADPAQVVLGEFLGPFG